MENEIKVVSLFSGIGGFEVGLENSMLKYKVVFSSEIDKYASISYLSNFKDNNLSGDITIISEKDIPEHDLLVAGFPCQAFSIAGKRKGFEDTRGTLFFDVARILKEKKPKYILLENVKNLVSHNHGETFKKMINVLNEIGYTLDFSIINSSEAGVPQNRERTYIVGILNKKVDDVLFDTRSYKLQNLKGKLEYKGFNFFDTLTFNNRQNYIIDIIDDIFDEKYLINGEKITNYLAEIDLNYIKKVNKKIVKVFDLPKDIYNDLERQRRVYSIYGISPTILARSDATKILIEKGDKYLIRKITPKECFRLQGFKESFIKNIIDNSSISMTQAYKQAGNAVSPPVITGILNHLYIDYISKDKEISFIDLFCGLGGFRIALEKLGAKCSFSSDIDINVKNIYAKNFNEMPYGDITKISSEVIPNHDILCAGFPCQPFSLAGKRLGFDDVRGTLFFDVARILHDKQPKGFILENVKGIVNHDSGRTLERILSILDEIGYECKYEVLNAKDFGIPQNRERWYCVGIRKDLKYKIKKFIFPEKEELKLSILDIIDDNIVDPKYKISESCRKNINIHIEKRNIKITDITLASEIRPSRCVFNNKGFSNCLTAKMGTGGSNVPVIVKKGRKFTEKECLKLMGFPENYIIGEGYQAYKQIGNSVVVPLIEKIARNLIYVLKNE
ncbi:DNA (cytosine-5-)-methyltransferase [Peptostreptococcus sp.]|uniref:DNA (cytosine-5-)-methyltransferase n=1 Tax=Peptostreptococcus sp. TaxID=1262 RepID=UPI0039947054